MANPEHLAILKQGVKVWNEWREQNRDVRPDLNRADLNGQNLAFENFRRANLEQIHLAGATLKQADFVKAAPERMRFLSPSY